MRMIVMAFVRMRAQLAGLHAQPSAFLASAVAAQGVSARITPACDAPACDAPACGALVGDALPGAAVAGRREQRWAYVANAVARVRTTQNHTTAPWAGAHATRLFEQSGPVPDPLPA